MNLMNWFGVWILAAGVNLAVAAEPVAAGKAATPSKPPAARVMAPSNPALIQKLNDNVRRMHQQMDQIQAARDEKERDRLLQEHRSSMDEQMQLMQSLAGRGAIGPVATGAGPGSVLDRRLSLLEQRMELLQQMMMQVIKHQEQSQNIEAPKSAP